MRTLRSFLLLVIVVPLLLHVAFLLVRQQLLHPQDPGYRYQQDPFGGDHAMFAVAVFSRFAPELVTDYRRMSTVGAATFSLDDFLHTTPGTDRLHKVKKGSQRFDPSATYVELNMYFRHFQEIVHGIGFILEAASFLDAQALASEASRYVSNSNERVRSGEFVIRAVRLGSTPAVVGRLPWNWLTNGLFHLYLFGHFEYPSDEFLSMVHQHNGEDYDDSVSTQQKDQQEGEALRRQNEDERWSRVRCVFQVDDAKGMQSLHFYHFVSEHHAEESRYMKEIYGAASENISSII